MEPTGWICGPKIYEYAGWIFEESQTGAPWPLKKDGELRARAGRKFYRDIEPFCDMSNEEKKRYRVGGGCQAF